MARSFTPETGRHRTTTLRVYAAWVGEADQRAATTLAARLGPCLGRDLSPIMKFLRSEGVPLT
jgi:hypothetical protein